MAKHWFREVTKRSCCGMLGRANRAVWNKGEERGWESNGVRSGRTIRFSGRGGRAGLAWRNGSRGRPAAELGRSQKAGPESVHLGRWHTAQPGTPSTLPPSPDVAADAAE